MKNFVFVDDSPSIVVSKVDCNPMCHITYCFILFYKKIKLKHALERLKIYNRFI